MDRKINAVLGRRLKRRRRLIGMTQQHLAELCGLRFQQIQKYECGVNRISAAKLYIIARALEVDVTYFYDGLEETLSVSWPRTAPETEAAAARY